MTAPLEHVLALALVLFAMGAACALARKNLIMILLGVEVMLNACGVALVGASLKWQALEGQAFALFIMALGAAEAAVGLAILVTFFRNRGDIAVDDASMMKG